MSFAGSLVVFLNPFNWSIYAREMIQSVSDAKLMWRASHFRSWLGMAAFS
jgi:hypothetical protein